MEQKSKTEKQLIKEHNKIMRERTFANSLNESMVRARSITIGTAFGGTTEVTMRRPDGTVTFVILQPVEAIELVHQLAASVGCHINLQPRRDFASWRNWKYTEEELAHYRGNNTAPGVGHPPHANPLPYDQGQKLPMPKAQPGMQPALMVKNESEKQTVATQKTLKRRSVKRAAASA